MATIKQQAKSRTVQFNVIATAIIAILNSFGIEIPAEAAAGILAVGNYILRLITIEPLENK